MFFPPEPEQSWKTVRADGFARICSDGSLPVSVLDRVMAVWQNATVLTDSPKTLPPLPSLVS